MKLFTIATIVALPSANAVYYACCKRAGTCPTDRNNTKTGNSSFDVCCYDGQSTNGTALDDIPTCLEDIETEGGVSITLYNTPEATVTSNTPEVAVTSTSNASEVTTISATTSTNDCCLALAAAQPGKLRSTATSVCPDKMYSIDGAAQIDGKMNYQVCCDKDGLTSDINAEGFPVCDDTSTKTQAESIDSDKPPELETNLDDGSDNTTETPVESTNTTAPPQEETDPEEGSNSANVLNVAMMCVALVNVALQAVL